MNNRLKLRIKHTNTITNENELVKRCINEEREAQLCLFNMFSGSMHGVCMRYAQSAEEANDMLQEGFIMVFNQLKSFRFESSLKTWITRIMINCSINYLRKYHKVKWDYSMDEAEEMSYEQPLGYDTAVVMNCIQELPAGYRIVLNMFAIEGYSHKEIAKELNIQEATSRSQYAKAKNALIKLLSKKGIYYEQQGARSF